ncbi:hypothetical protein CCS41_05010 [Candidatus Fukatsuia symbiotica]|uniref:Cyclic nucleotide-binding domain-containing protein n=1 Tax=Candidatus Fukatsuia symbiotica TaxID=1878942 RepID=A0A2U8I7R6_9GAMM|nr:type III secretion system translocon subunit SctE [Candidatus Fukatsuia symbiotica]AWK13984.1 hypothetical protein CCS41_05010 [Candidatus Fukatsuia symbiotica]
MDTYTENQVSSAATPSNFGPSDIDQVGSDKSQIRRRHLDKSLSTPFANWENDANKVEFYVDRSNVLGPKISESRVNEVLARLLPGTNLENLLAGGMMSIAEEASVTVVSAQNKISTGSGQQIKSNADLEQLLRTKQSKEYMEQFEKSVDQADKARKGGIFSAVFDWVIGAAEVVYGAFKIAAALATFDPLSLAAGVSYVTAGVACLVKAAAETCLLAGVGDKKTLDQVIEKAGEVQFGFEMAAMALDVLQIGRMVKGAYTVVKGASSALKEGAAEALSAVSSTATKGSANLFLQESVQRTATVVARTATEQMTGTIGKSLTKEVMEKLVVEVIEKAVVKTIQKGARLSAKKLTQQIILSLCKDMSLKMLKNVMLSSNVLAVVSGAAHGGRLSVNMLMLLLTITLKNK